MDLLDDANKVEKRLVAKATLAHIPITASFELTPCCNMQCNMCFISMKQTEVQAHGGIKGLDFWLQKACELKEMGTLFILLTGGEPLLYPDFKELYKALREMGFIVTLNTNGTCITEDIAKLFKEYLPRRVNVTLYGASKETYVKLCHHSEGFNQCINGITLLKKYNIDTKLNVSVVKENQHEFTNILAIGDKFSIPAVVNSYMFPCSRSIRNQIGIKESRLEPEIGGKYDALAAKYTKGTFFKEKTISILNEIEQTEANKNPITLSCRAGRNSLWINWQGVMTPCVMMEYPSINLNHISVKDAWQEIRKMCTLLPSHNECIGCKLRNLCQVCYASAALEEQHYGTINYLCKFTQSEYNTLKQLVNEKN